MNHLRIELTKACNLSCDYCYNQGEKSPEMTKREILFLAQQARAAGIKCISFTGGEPFMKYRLLKEVLPHLAEFDTGIITNGTLMNRSIAKSIHELKLGWVRISIEGASKQVHDVCMGRHDSFEHIKDTIHILKSHSIAVNVRTTVSKMNLHDLENIAEFCQSEGVGELRYQPYFFVKNGSVDKRHILSVDEHRQALFRLRKIRDRRLKIKVILDYGWFDFLYPGYNEKYPYVPSPCGRTFIFVDSSGNLQSCGPSMQKIANIHDKDFNLPEILKDSEILKSYNNYGPGGVCSLCGKTKTCKGGCPAKVFNMYGEMNRPQPMCPIVREYSYSLVWPLPDYLT